MNRKILLLSHEESSFCVDAIDGFKAIGFEVDYIYKSRLVPEIPMDTRDPEAKRNSWRLFRKRAKKLQQENRYLACFYLNWDPNFHSFTPYESSIVIWLDPSHHCIGSQPYRAVTICKEGGEDYLLWGTPPAYRKMMDTWKKNDLPKPYKYAMFCRIQLSAIASFYEQRFLPGIASFVNRTCTRYIAAQHLYSVHGNDFHLFGDPDGWSTMYKMYNKDLFSASVPFEVQPAPFRQLPEYYARSQTIIDHTRPENYINPKGLIALGLGIPLQTVVRLPHKPFIEIIEVDPDKFKTRDMEETCVELMDRAIGHKKLIPVDGTKNLKPASRLWQGVKVATLGSFDPESRQIIYDADVMNQDVVVKQKKKDEEGSETLVIDETRVLTREDYDKLSTRFSKDKKKDLKEAKKEEKKNGKEKNKN